jgi:hypothetical protein
MHTVLAGGPLLGSATEAIKSRCYSNWLEANLHKVRPNLCLRQSASDSTGPKIDIAPRTFGQWDIQGNVPEVQPSTRFQHPYDFGKGAFFFWNEVQNTVRTYHVDAPIRNRQGRSVAFADFHLRQPGYLGGFACPFYHGIGHINTNRVTSKSDTFRCEKQIHAGTAPNIEDGFAGLNGTYC